MLKRYSLLLTLLAAGFSSPLRAQPAGAEFQVNTYTPNSQDGASVAADANGNFVVTWNSPQDGNGSGVFGQRYDREGNPLGQEFQVNTYTKGLQGHSAVATASDGVFVVVWTSGIYQDGDFDGIFGQRYDRE